MCSKISHEMNSQSERLLENYKKKKKKNRRIYIVQQIVIYQARCFRFVFIYHKSNDVLAERYNTLTFYIKLKMLFDNRVFHWYMKLMSLLL